MTGPEIVGSLPPRPGSTVIEADNVIQSIQTLSLGTPTDVVVIGDHGGASGQQVGTDTLRPGDFNPVLPGDRPVVGDDLAGVAPGGTLVLTGCNVGNQAMQDALRAWLIAHPNVGQVIVSTGLTYWSAGSTPTGNWITITR